jgi:hypothetical protein
MKKIRIRSLNCRQLVYSKRSIIKTFEAKGWIDQNKMKEGFAFSAGGSEPFIREVGWREEHFRQGLVIFHKSIRFLSLICPKTAC